MNKSYSVYFPNTEFIADILASTWDIDNNNLLTFYDDGNMVSSRKRAIAVFNMNNILGFKENEDGID